MGGDGPTGPVARARPPPSEDIEALIEDRAGPTRPVGNVSKLAQTAHGNPLFAEQLLAALRRSRDRGDPGSTAWPVGNAPGPARAG
jgi:hypothetical protein